jgi:hypothetical protein
MSHFGNLPPENTPAGQYIDFTYESFECTADNRPAISSVSPQNAQAGETVTLSGDWRTGSDMKAACHWFVDQELLFENVTENATSHNISVVAAEKLGFRERRTDFQAYQTYTSGSINSDGDIECEVPTGDSSFPDVAGHDEDGIIVRITVSVWSENAVTTGANHGLCMSHFGASPNDDEGNGKFIEFSYSETENDDAAKIGVTSMCSLLSVLVAALCLL